MGAFEFIASVIDSLAWPAALVVLALVLRQELKGLLRRLTKLRHKETEISFTEAIQELRDQLEPQVWGGSSDTEIQRPDPSATEIATALAEFPESAIVAAWGLLEVRLRKMAHDLGLENERSVSVPSLISFLKSKGAIKTADVTLLAGVRRLRNEAAHGALGEDLTPTMAEDYGKTIDLLGRRLGLWDGARSPDGS